MSDDFGKRDKREGEEREVPIEVHSGRQEDSSGDPEPSGQRGTSPAASPEAFARLVAEKEELLNTLVRRQADFDNYRKRVERDRKDEARRGTGRLLLDLLPVLDGFDRALAGHPAEDEYRKGVQLIQRHLWDTLSKHGLERIAAEGKTFDPHYHEAIDRVETHEHADGTILQVVQEGYLFDGRVLRPSLVRVAVAPEGAGGDKSSAAHTEVH
jgi:molecular chaperone GrpE